MFIHLRAHSYYSLLEGLPSPAQLAQAAVRMEMPALALTDTHLVSGAVEFYDACRSAGLQPIMGLELQAAFPPDFPLAGHLPLAGDGLPQGKLVFLAMDLTGWSSLCRLSSALQSVLDPAEQRPLPFKQLAENTQGLICLTGGRAGWLAKLILSKQGDAAQAALERLADLFPGRLYVELQAFQEEDIGWILPLCSQARRARLPLLITNDIHYLSPEQAALQRLLTAIRLNLPLDRLPDTAAAPPGAYFTNQAVLEQRWRSLVTPVRREIPGFSELASATQEIAARCCLDLPLGKPHFPEVILQGGQTADQLLRQRAEAGARKLYNPQSADAPLAPEIRQRLDHELEVIAACGYASLFLVMEEILQYARKTGVPISSRGSAGSSLVAHCLGITSPDPMRLNLYFERFLNPARATPPDIDTDLCSRRRDEVIRFVYRRFGADRAAMVCTVNRFRSRSALRETAKAYGLPSEEIKKLADSLPHRWWSPSMRSSNDSPYAELEELYRSPLHQALFRDARELIGIPDHLSLHPGGMVISPGPITDLVATQMAAKGVIVTQFDLDSIERFGLVKMDLLGIRGLTVIGDLAELIFSGQAQAASSEDFQTRDWSAPLDVLESIPEKDPPTSELLRHGKTIGCFQIESPGMRATLKEIQASTIDDLMVALALYRPGPLTGGFKDAFVRRHRRLEEAAYLHPSLVPLLSDTYGVILYQEQVLRIAHELAGLSLADSDLLRRAMSHFDPGKQMQTLKEKFIAGALERSAVPADIAERVWELMAAFSGYGFPKAHAASYAQVSWRSAWCKTHFPAQFMAAVLANWGGYYRQRTYLTEARRLKLAVRPPHVNYSRPEFSVTYLEGQPVLFMGLDQVSELTRSTQARIFKERPFKSLADFLARADPRPVEADRLVRVGALRGMGTIPRLLSELEKGSWQRGQLPLFGFGQFEAGSAGQSSPDEDWSLEERAAAQESILGASPEIHPLELVTRQIGAAGALTTVEAAGRIGKRVRIAGMKQTWRRSQTVKGDFVYFMSSDDLEGMLDVVIFSDIYRRSRDELSGHGPFIIEGIVELDTNAIEPFIRAEKIWRLG